MKDNIKNKEHKLEETSAESLILMERLQAENNVLKGIIQKNTASSEASNCKKEDLKRQNEDLKAANHKLNEKIANQQGTHLKMMMQYEEAQKSNLKKKSIISFNRTG